MLTASLSFGSYFQQDQKLSLWNRITVVSSKKTWSMNTMSFRNVACTFEMLMSPTAITLWYKKVVVLFAEKYIISIEFSEKIYNLKFNLSSCEEHVHQQNRSGMCEETNSTGLAEGWHIIQQWLVYNFQIHTQFKSLLNFLISMLSSGTFSLCCTFSVCSTMPQTWSVQSDLSFCCSF